LDKSEDEKMKIRIKDNNMGITQYYTFKSWKEATITLCSMFDMQIVAISNNKKVRK